MNPKPKHTTPSPNSKAAAFGYEQYSSSANKALYAKSSKTGYTYLACRQAGFGPAAPRIPSHSKRTTNKGLNSLLCECLKSCSSNPFAFQKPRNHSLITRLCIFYIGCLLKISNNRFYFSYLLFQKLFGAGFHN